MCCALCAAQGNNRKLKPAQEVEASGVQWLVNQIVQFEQFRLLSKNFGYETASTGCLVAGNCAGFVV